MPPLISVIVPNYNHEKYLVERIETIFAQTYKNIELIILDDYSTDNSRQIIEQYRIHPLVKTIIYNRKNSGSPFKQWNVGILQAKGEYIWIAESDDYCDCNFLEIAVKKLENCYCDLFYAQSSAVVNSKVVNKFDWFYADISSFKWNNSYENFAKDEIKNYLMFKNTIINASAVVFRNYSFVKDILLEVEGEFRYAGDWYFWLNYLHRSNRICFSTQTANYFRYHENTTRANSSYKRNLEVLKIYKWCCENILFKRDDDTLYAYYERHHFIFLARKKIYINMNQAIRSLKYGSFFFKTMIRYYKSYLNSSY